MTVQKSIFKIIGIKKFIPGIAWFFLVLVLIATPGYSLPKADKWMIQISYDKIIHMGMFAVMAFLFMYPFVRSSALTRKQKWHYCIKIAISTAVWGLGTELIQKFFVPSRSFDLTDLLGDAIGGLAALIFCRKYYLNPSSAEKAAG
jgi:VanZ family protein